VPWVTVFGFLRRLGLEQYAFNLEDAGYGLWSELKALSKDELKDNGDMSDKSAKLCHAVLSCCSDRPDLLRAFQIPEFGDIVDMFCLRFPDADRQHPREFALQITDELGITEFSCLQVQRYLEQATSASAAQAGAQVRSGLLTLVEAEAARVRPPAPAPPKEPDDWLYTWLKAEKLEGCHMAFMGQALCTREDILLAPLDHDALKQLGIPKIGEQSKLLRMIEAERKSEGA